MFLPEEPFVWGVSHISPRTDPSNIGRPPYARTLAGDKRTLHSSRSGYTREPHQNDSRIRLGAEEETELRASSRLARRFSGTFVKVGMVLEVLLTDGMMTPSSHSPAGITTNSIAIHDFIVAHGAYLSS